METNRAREHSHYRRYLQRRLQEVCELEARLLQDPGHEKDAQARAIHAVNLQSLRRLRDQLERELRALD